jgi:hypothetical protein
MAPTDPAIEYSKKLCEEARALRSASKSTIAECKAALARSQGIVARIKQRKKSKLK